MSKIVLCADDSVTMQQVAEITFRTSPFTYVGARTAEEAMQLLQSQAPSLVLADAIMPGKSGYELCQAIKSNPGTAHIPVVLVCGNSEPYDEARGQQVGAAGHVTKPWDSEVLLKKVEEFAGAQAAPPAPTPAAMPPQPSAPARPPAIDPQNRSATIMGLPQIQLPDVGGAAPVAPTPPRQPSQPSQPPRPASQPPPVRPSTAGPARPAPRPTPQPHARPTPEGGFGPGARVPTGVPSIPAPPTQAAPPSPKPQGAPFQPMQDKTPPRPVAPSGNLRRSPMIKARPARSLDIKSTVKSANSGASTGPARNTVPRQVSDPRAPTRLTPDAPKAPPTGVATPSNPSVPTAPAKPGPPALATPQTGSLDERVRQRVAQTPAVKAAGLSADSPELAALTKLSREVIEQVVWEVVPELAEVIIKENLDKLK